MSNDKVIPIFNQHELNTFSCISCNATGKMNKDHYEFVRYKRLDDEDCNADWETKKGYLCQDCGILIENTHIEPD